jgi:hypothetical protein
MKFEEIIPLIRARKEIEIYSPLLQEWLDFDYEKTIWQKDMIDFEFRPKKTNKEPLKFEIESHFCTNRYYEKNILCLCGENEVNFEIPYNAIKKFKVTFEELPND